jgi:hypothetical protein
VSLKYKGSRLSAWAFACWVCLVMDAVCETESMLTGRLAVNR